MGYMTRYNLDIQGDKQDINKAYAYISKDEYVRWAIEGEDCKWYDHHDFMKKISTEFPSLVFILHGNGEDRPDIWYKYYKNGKYYDYRPDFKAPPFDESKLT